MLKKDMKKALEKLDLNLTPHIFVPSYNRPEFVTANMFKDFYSWDPELKKSRIHIVVRSEQARAYRKANPDLHILPIPEDYNVNGLASTRQFIFEYAAEHKYSVIIDMDDDIKNLAYMYDGVSGSGNPCSKHTIKIDREEDPLIQQRVLAMAGAISKIVFRTHPEVMLGNIRRQRLSQNEENAKLMYIINRGPTPRQVTLLNVKGLVANNVNRSMRFERHGDDIGFCAEILKKNLSLFNIPCLTYDYVSEKCDSVCRTPETEKELHALEYRMLQKYPIKEYLRTTFRDEEGNYMWGDVDFTKYRKLTGANGEKKYWRKNDV